MTEKHIILYCLEEECGQKASMEGYCRLHYLKNWKSIQLQKKLKKERKLNEYVDHIVHKYPHDYLRVIREDLASDKDLTDLLSEATSDTAHLEEFDDETQEILQEIKKKVTKE
ncbi:MAG: hypothetical protein HYS98_06345 [Deltaproteobacteria bacterium]|nr:hypothetical protein [Deltaproteobacteria bacterium]